MNIKSYIQFIKESNIPPGPDNKDSMVVTLEDDEILMFSNEPILSNLISTQKVCLIENEIYFYDEKETKEILNMFFPEKI
jgi:hypothetical protein